MGEDDGGRERQRRHASRVDAFSGFLPGQTVVRLGLAGPSLPSLGFVSLLSVYDISGN